MNRALLVLTLSMALRVPTADASAVDNLLDHYRQQGVTAFSAERGATLWAAPMRVGGESRDCTGCHGADLKQPGRQINTGKRIEPMAPSANPRRLADSAKIEKWFKRNCKWTWGRVCTPQEKGDLLRYLQQH